jgi:hypothetical protein
LSAVIGGLSARAGKLYRDFATDPATDQHSFEG